MTQKKRSAIRTALRRGCLTGLVLVLLTALVLIGLVIQARRTPTGKPIYVALGSSYAAGAGLGPLQSDSPLVCARSVGGYPPRLARMLDMPLVDMSCGGAVTRHILTGGQFLQGAQLRVIDARTRLVTITFGGNDVGYVGDLSMLAARRSTTLFGRLVRLAWGGPRHERNWQGLYNTLLATLRTIHQRAPHARIVVTTYPAVLPVAGTCVRLGLSTAEADEMRAVAARLAQTVRDAASAGGAILVDLDRLGHGHDACSTAPWTNGWWNVTGAPFHPNRAGAQYSATLIATALGNRRP